MSRKKYRVYMPGNPMLMDSSDELGDACTLAKTRSAKLESPMRVVAADNREVGYVGHMTNDYDYCSEDGFAGMAPRIYNVTPDGLTRKEGTETG